MFTKLSNAIFGTNRQTNKQKKGAQKQRKLRLEDLENRELLSVAPLSIHLESHEDHDHDHDHDPVTTELCTGCLAYSPATSQEYYGAADIDANAPVPFSLDETFTLHSRPDSQYRIYLDFDGFDYETNWGQADANGTAKRGWSLDSDFTSFSDWELQNIQWIWQIIADKYSIFDVDVTTDVAMCDKPGNEWMARSGALRVVFGAEGDWGGIAFLNSFNWTSDTPCYVQNYGGRSAATVAAHEIGHTVGLGHDGQPSGDGEYYGGHNVYDVRTGTSTKWGPIMGAAYGTMEQFSKGEYNGANNFQDDFEVMSRYMPIIDDAGLVFVREGELQIAKGLIERPGDVDSTTFTVEKANTRFSFDAISGVDIDGQQVSSLYYVLSLTNSTTGAVIFESYSPLNSFNVTWVGTLAAGSYTLSIAGAGVAAHENLQGFSSYGSVGAYTITVDGSFTPTPPMDFRSTSRSTNSVTLQWSAQPRLTGYILQYKKSSDDEWTTWKPAPGANAATATVKGLTDDTRYDFRLCATNQFGPSDWVTTSVTTLALPKKPDLSAKSVENSSIRLSWTTQQDADQYIIYRSTSPSSGFVEVTRVPGAFSTTTTYTDAGLTGNTMYYYYAVATNTVDKLLSPQSDTVFAITSVVPTGTSLSDTSIKIQWTASVGFVANYRIYRSDTIDGEYKNIATLSKSVEYTDTNLKGNTDYFYRIVSIDVATGLESALSEILTVATKPSVVTELVANQTGPARVTLSWTAPENVDGCVYRIWRQSRESASFEVIAEIVGTRYVDNTGGGVGMEYEYTIETVNDVKGTASELSSLVSLTLVKQNDHDLAIFEAAKRDNGLADSHVTWGKVEDEIYIASINAPNKGLHGTIVLTDCIALTELDLWRNNLIGLVLDGCTALQTVDCALNNLLFSTCPVFPQTVTQLVMSPQQEMKIRSTVVVGEIFDELASEYLIGTSVTTYQWYYANNALVEAQYITSEGNGRFSFSDELFGKEIYCVLTNSSFGGLKLQTTKTTVASYSPKPATPTGFFGVDNGNDWIEVQWDSSDDETILGYVLSYKKMPEDTWKEIQLGPDVTSYTLNQLDVDTLYDFQLVAYNSIGSSDAPAECRGSTMAGHPLQPKHLAVAEVTTSTVKLTWEAQGMLTGYTLAYRVAGSSTWITASAPSAVATSAVVAGLSVNTTYEFRLTAKNSYGTAESTVSATTPKKNLATPTQFKSTGVTSSSVRFAWNTVAGADSYKLEVSLDGSNWDVVDANIKASEYTHNGLQPSTKYYYRLTASSDGSNSAPTPSVSVTTNNVTIYSKPPTAASGVKGTASVSSVDLRWNAGKDVEEYIVTCFLGKTEIGQKSVTDTSVTFNDLAAGKKYSFTVTAKNSFNSGSYAKTVKGSVKTLTLTAPKGFKVAQVGLTSAALKWNTAQSGVTGFELTATNRKTGATMTFNTISASATGYTISGLDANARYAFSIRAVVDTGSKVLTSQAVKTTATTRKAVHPKVTVAKYGIELNAITLNWADVRVDSPFSETPVGYDVYFCTSKSGTYEKVTSVTRTQGTVNGLQSDTTYYFKIASIFDGVILSSSDIAKIKPISAKTAS